MATSDTIVDDIVLKRAVQKIIQDDGQFGEVDVEADEGAKRRIIVLATIENIHWRGTLALSIYDKMCKQFPMSKFRRIACKYDKTGKYDNFDTEITLYYDGEKQSEYFDGCC